MDKTESINQLLVLLDDLEAQHREKEALDKAEENRQGALTRFRKRLELFDEEYKKPYIAEKIGREPVRPKGLLKLAVPVYLAKKAKYEKAIVDYRKRYALAEKAYYFDFQEKRAELQETAEREKNDAIASANAEYDRANQAYQDAAIRVSANTILSAKYKTTEIVSVLIDYLRDGRADSLKEAINLWHDEERKRIEMENAEAHRAEMLRLEQERLEAAEEAAEYQRKAYYAAQEAADSARDAANEARRVADEVRYSNRSE